MRKKVLALVLFVAMLLALIPGGTASAAITKFEANVQPNAPYWQVNGSANTNLVLTTGGNQISSLGSATSAFTYVSETNGVRNVLANRTPIVAKVTGASPVDGTKIWIDIAGVPTEKEVLASGTAANDIYIDGTELYRYVDGTSDVLLTSDLYVYAVYATTPYSSIYGNGQTVSAEGSWSNLSDNYTTWYGNPADTSNGRQFYISVPVKLEFAGKAGSNLGTCDIYVNGVATSIKSGTPDIITVNLLPAAGGNTATAKIEIYDRNDNYAYATRTITLNYTDTSYSVTANTDLNAKVIGKSGNQAANFNVRLEGSTFIVDVAAQTSDDIAALNANAAGGGDLDRKNVTTDSATSTQKSNKDVSYLFTFTIQPLKADGTPYDYHTRIYPTAMKVYNNNNSFLIGSANRYQQVAGDPANSYYEIDSNGNIVITLRLTQKDLVDGYIKTNNKLSSGDWNTSTKSFAFTLGVPGAPKFAFDIVVNNVSRTSTTGTLSATELALETGASATLGVTYPTGAFTTTTTFKAYSDGITVTADGNTATVTAGATAGTYFVIVTTADNNITIVPVVVTDPAAAVDETAGTYTITGRGVRIRTAPDTSTSKNIAKTTKKGDKVEVTSITDGWALLADGNYISAKYLTKD